MSVTVLHNEGILDDMEGQWQKLCAVVLHKFGVNEVKIAPEDIVAFAEQFGGEMPCIFVDGRGGKDITIRVMSQTAAEKFLREVKSD